MTFIERTDRVGDNFLTAASTLVFLEATLLKFWPLLQSVPDPGFSSVLDHGPSRFRVNHGGSNAGCCSLKSGRCHHCAKMCVWLDRCFELLEDVQPVVILFFGIIKLAIGFRSSKAPSMPTSTNYSLQDVALLQPHEVQYYPWTWTSLLLV
jgi:hypothetical protein